jgi:uncharacterized protein (TIGR02246 family)
MKTALYAVFFATLLSFPVGVKGADPDEPDPRRAVEQANADLGAAFAKGDFKAVAEMYTETGRLLPPNSEVIEGRKAIEEFWRGVMSAGVKSIKLKSIEIEHCNDIVFEQGTATLFGKDNAVIDRGKYLVMWKRAEGKWKLHRDCWNSSEPAPSK